MQSLIQPAPEAGIAGQPVGTFSIIAKGGSLTVKSLKIHEMTSIWNKK